MRTSKQHTPLSHLPFRPSTQQVFSTRGFESSEEVEESFRSGGLSNLASELGTSLSEAGSIWKELRQIQKHFGKENCSQNGNSIRSISAKALLSQQANGSSRSNSPSNIITFCREIDQILGGGLALGELTEIAGPPGVGKTQWAMQLAVDASLPQWAGGVAGEACYIDTEGSFAPERCLVFAEALIKHIQTGLARRRQRQPELPLQWDTTAEDILKGIHVFRVHDNAALHATLEGSLPKLAAERWALGKSLRLVVVDSVAFPVRAMPNSGEVDFFVSRSRQLLAYASQLSQLAAEYRLAAVAINQMTTKLTNESSQLVPALGEGWAHAVTTRLMLSSNGDRRQCSLTKSPRLPLASAHYKILEIGIRGEDYRTSSSAAPNQSGQKRSMVEMN